MIRTLIWEAVLLAVFFAIAIAAYFDERTPHRDVVAIVLHEPFHGVGALVYRWSGYVIRNCRGHLRREVHQGANLYHLPDKPFTWIPSEDWDPTEKVELIVAVDLSDFHHELDEGEASYHVTEIAACNQIQAMFGGKVETKYPPVSFIISK